MLALITSAGVPRAAIKSHLVNIKQAKLVLFVSQEYYLNVQAIIAESPFVVLALQAIPLFLGTYRM